MRPKQSMFQNFREVSTQFFKIHLSSRRFFKGGIGRLAPNLVPLPSATSGQKSLPIGRDSLWAIHGQKFPWWLGPARSSWHSMSGPSGRIGANNILPFSSWKYVFKACFTQDGEMKPSRIGGSWQSSQLPQRELHACKAFQSWSHRQFFRSYEARKGPPQRLRHLAPLKMGCQNFTTAVDPAVLRQVCNPSDAIWPQGCCKLQWSEARGSPGTRNKQSNDLCQVFQSELLYHLFGGHKKSLKGSLNKPNQQNCHGFSSFVKKLLDLKPFEKLFGVRGSPWGRS